MSDKVVNLRQWRKSKARSEKKAEADRNATMHGLPRQVTDLARARAEKAARELDAHRIDEDASE